IYYRATLLSEWSEVSGSFHTAPDKVAGQLKFFGFGDTKPHIGKCSIDVCKLCDDVHDYIPHCDDCDDCDDTSKLNIIAGAMNAYSAGSREAAFVIHTGDIVQDGGIKPEKSFDPLRDFAVRDMWRDYFFNVDGVKNLLKRKGIFTTPGNHDFYTPDESKVSTYNYWKHFPYHEYDGRVTEDSHSLWNMYYKFDWGPAEFYSLNTYPMDGYCGHSTSLEHTGEQIRWFESNLAKNSDRQWKIVFLHVPAYSPECNQGQLQNYWKPLFEKYGVDLVLQGHEHYYSRITKPGPFGNPNGIPYLVLGGGGAELS
ncbi:MAG: metallophosphoesterase, partial [Campylobacterota bacterium]|nr:metallophosphoesterase [Campylobacterota bacterium]